MYHSMLDKVIRAINLTIDTDPQNKTEEFYNYLFNPEAYLRQQEERREKEKTKKRLIAGATIVAALGEAYYLARPHLHKLSRKNKK